MQEFSHHHETLHNSFMEIKYFLFSSKMCHSFFFSLADECAQNNVVSKDVFFFNILAGNLHFTATWRTNVSTSSKARNLSRKVG